MKPYEEMNLTAYLQTEGRRRAAELAAIAASSPATAASPAVRQSQADLNAPARQPESLSEFLRGMGITPSPVRSSTHMKPQRQL